LPLETLTVYEGIQVTIEVPFGYAEREQLLSFIESKFPGAEISIVHSEVAQPTASEAMARHDSETADPPDPGADSGAVLLKVSEAVSEFAKSRE
jgi:hypothetical protein